MLKVLNKLTRYSTYVLLLLSVSLSGQVDVDSVQQIITGNSSDSLKADSAIKLANYYKERNVDTSNHYIQEAITFIDTAMSSELAARYFFTLSKIQFKEAKGERALYNAEKAYHLLEQVSENLSLKGDVVMAISRAYFVIRDYESSLEYSLKGEQIGREGKDSFLLTNSFDIRGNIMRMTKHYEKSIEYFKQGLAINRLMDRDKSAARNLANIATVYSVMKEYEKSKPYFKEAIKIGEENDDNFQVSFSSGNLGMNYVELEQTDSARTYLEKALAGYTTMNNQFRILRTTSQLASLHMSTGEFEDAVHLLLPAYNQSLDLSDIKLQDDLAFNLGDSYEQMGNYKLANKYHRIHMSLQDSMINEDVSNAVSEAEAKYESEKKQAEIERLSLEDRLNEERISKQRMALGGSGLGIGLLSLLLYRLFGQNKQIKTQNQVITKANGEKEVLLKEIHHRVKNNLQVISSLLGLQSLSIEDQKAKDAIQEGRSRVHSMSLIHQNLYKKDNLTGIEMAPYIKKLCNDLIQTYHVGDTDITLYEDVQQGIILDVESVVPIGLIINELVTNCLKYAFEDKIKGLISVKLHEVNGQLHLVVGDDGIGMQGDSQDSKKESFGHSLIRAFKEKLQAELDITTDSGTTVLLKINQYKKT